MHYIESFRDGALAAQLSAAIAREVRPDRTYRFMEFCGGHTHAIARYGLADRLPQSVQMIHGPGCPVCVLPIERIDQAIELALDPRVVLCTYGDCLRVPASGGQSLSKAKAQGADVRMVYSAADALALARRMPTREVVFLAIGFETTTPPTAVVVQQARAEGLTNFSILCCHVLTPPAMRAILDSPRPVALDGLIGPAHVSAVIGSAPYAVFAEQDHLPVVIAGFEPLDVLQAVRMLVAQVNAGVARVENEYTRAVTPEGNLQAQAIVASVFELRADFAWRGLGTLPHSALRLRPAFAQWDAEQRFDLTCAAVADHPACECGAILRGHKHPRDCRIFGTVCTPDNPIGACMVSSEGACAAHFSYGRHGDQPTGEGHRDE